MEVQLRHVDCSLHSADAQYVTQKIGRLAKHLSTAMRAEIVHKHEKDGHHVDVSIYSPMHTIYAGHVDANVRAAADRVSDKLDKQIETLKTKQKDNPNF